MVDFKQYIDFGLAKGAEEVEIFYAETRSNQLKVFKGEVDTLLSSIGVNIAVRAFKGGKMGFAYTSNLSDEGLKAVISEAISNADLLGTTERHQLPDLYNTYPEVDIYSEELRKIPVEEKIKFALSMEKAALEYDPRIAMVMSASLNDKENQIRIVNSKGLDQQYKKGYIYGMTYAIARENERNQTGGGFGIANDLSGIDARQIGEEASEEAVALLGATPVPSQHVPVLFKNSMGAMIFYNFVKGFQADRVQKDKSLFKGKLGQQIANPLVTLVDDALNVQGFNAAPFDDEGVPSQQTIVVEDGILKSYLYDSYTAAIDGVKSTGNARREEFWELPEVTPTNFYLKPGDATFEEMVASIEEGLLVMEISGIHSGTNPISGDFSVGATGIWIKNGKLAQPVREITIAGNFSDLLKNIVQVGNDLKFEAGAEYMGSPSFVVKELAVSGS